MTRITALMTTAEERSINVNTSAGRRWMPRAAAGKHEGWVRAMTPERTARAA